MSLAKEKEQMLFQTIELEREVINLMGKVRAYEQSIQQLKRNIQKCNITLKEISNLQDQPTFAPLGRSFLIKQKSDIANDITEIIKTNEKDIAEYEKLKNVLLQRGKEKENQLQEQVKTLKSS